ncbi:unnamed protein product [Closterium sp. NIES-53]
MHPRTRTTSRMQTVGLHQHSRLDEAWRAEFGDEAERPCWVELLRCGVAMFDLDYDAILVAMYALSVSAEGDCCPCVPSDPGIEASTLGASGSALPGTAPAEALHTFTLDSILWHNTTLTPLSTHVPVRLADSSGGPVVARSSTVLLCPAVQSGSLSGLHLPSFFTNLVSTAALQDAMVTTTTPGGQRILICTCTPMGHHLATFTLRPGSSLYTLAKEPPQVVASAQVSTSGHVAPPCSCRLLSHQTLLWHHHLGQPSLPHLRGMHSRLLVSGLPKSLPPLPPLPAPPCIPCVEGWQRAPPHSSSFPPTTAPLQTLHMDVWVPARISGQGRERYLRLVVDDYTRYTTVFPLRSKGEDLPVLFLHSDRGGEFSSNLLQDFCRGEGILQSFTLLDSPQHNGISECRIGLVMEPRVSLPETSPTLRWTRKVGDALVFRVWGSCAFVRDTSADKLSARSIHCVFLGFSPDARGWKFYHPTSRRVFPSRNITSPSGRPPPPLGPAPSGVSRVDTLPGTVPVEVAVDSGAAQDAASGGAELGSAEHGGVELGGAESEGAGSWGAEPGGAEPVGVESRRAEPEVVEPGGGESGGAEPCITASSGGLAGASPRLSPTPKPISLQQLREWFTQCTRLHITVGAGGTGGAEAAGPHGARTREPRAAGAGVVDASAGGTGAGGAGARGAGPVAPGAGVAGAGGAVSGGTGVGGTVRPRAYFPASTQPDPSPYTEQTGGLTEHRELASHTGRRVPRPRPSSVPSTHAMALCPSSVPLRVPLLPPPYSSLLTIPDPVFDLACADSPTVHRLLATVVTDPSFAFAAACRLDYANALVAESESDRPPYVGGECALGTDVLDDKHEDFECLAAAVPCFASMLLAPEGDPDAVDIPTPRSYAEAITGTYIVAVPPSRAIIVDGMWIFRMTTLRLLLHVAAQRDYELHSLDFSTAFLQGSLHEEIWLRHPLGFTESFPAGTQWSLRRPVYSPQQVPREWHDTLRTTLAALGFTPSTVVPSLFLRTDTWLPPFYILVYIDDLIFSTADTEALTLVNLELQKRHTCSNLGPSALWLPVLLATAHSSVY